MPEQFRDVEWGFFGEEYEYVYLRRGGLAGLILRGVIVAMEVGEDEGVLEEEECLMKRPYV